MSDSQIPVVISKTTNRKGNTIYTQDDIDMMRRRYESGERIRDISDETGIHEVTLYKYCADLVKQQSRKSTGRPSVIDHNKLVNGMRKGLTQAQIAEICGVTRQAVCMYIKRHNLKVEVEVLLSVGVSDVQSNNYIKVSKERGIAMIREDGTRINY